MSRLGIGAMLGLLSGNEETFKAYHSALNKKISAVKLDASANGGDGACIITFADGGTLTLTDDGRSCCESRYITCDDDLSSFGGATLVRMDVRAGDDVSGDYDVHETQFVDVRTTAGDFTLCTHNEHNGYYGGFCLRLSYAPAPHTEDQSNG